MRARSIALPRRARPAAADACVISTCIPANLFADGDDCTVAVDWSFVGIGAIGEDAGNLVADAVLDFHVDPAAARRALRAGRARVRRGIARRGRATCRRRRCGSASRRRSPRSTRGSPPAILRAGGGGTRAAQPPSDRGDAAVVGTDGRFPPRPRRRSALSPVLLRPFGQLPSARRRQVPKRCERWLPRQLGGGAADQAGRVAGELGEEPLCDVRGALAGEVHLVEGTDLDAVDGVGPHAVGIDVAC